MDRITQLSVAGSAGASGAAESLYVDDVFSTYLWTGTGSTQTITNGIDLAGEGGMIWTKGREVSENHIIHDSERGKTGSYYDALQTNVSNADNTGLPYGPTSFNSDGFTLGGNNAQFNGNGDGGYCSWTFRKAPGFFDVVTYTGNGTAGHTISHSLGSVPGLIMVKRRDTIDDWAVWHRSIGATKYLQLNLTDAAADLNTIWNDTEPTSTNFTVGVNGKTNTNGSTYVAYIFAHDEQSFGTNSDEAIVKCGSYTGNGSSTNGPVVDLGFEPQWLLIKNTTTADDWVLTDVWRDMTQKSALRLYPNKVGQDDTTTSGPAPLATGFRLYNNSAFWNTSGDNYIYIAIRRPHKPVTAATEVFDSYTGSPNSLVNVGFPADLGLPKNRNPGTITYLGTRLQGDHYTLFPTNTNVEEEYGVAERFVWDEQNKFLHNQGLGTCVAWVFKRAPGFLDVVTYEGDGANNRTVTHSLGQTPELIIVKNRDVSTNWPVWSPDTGTENLAWDESSAQGILPNRIKSATQTTFTVGDYSQSNGSGSSMIAFLFGTVSGVSKVGSYAGNGSSQTINCGFTSGARWVMIKPYDTTGSWLVFDTSRGINAGSADPYLRIDTNNVESTNDDYIDPDSTGFELSSGASAVNGSGNNYIFLAIA